MSDIDFGRSDFDNQGVVVSFKNAFATSRKRLSYYRCSIDARDARSWDIQA